MAAGTTSPPADTEARPLGHWPALALAIASVVTVLIVQADVGPRSSVAEQPMIPLAVGIALALLAGIATRTPALLLGAAAMIGFPLWAIGDLLLHPGPHDGPEHNLLPFEFLFYGGYMAAAWVAVLAGRGLRRLTARPA